MSNQADVPASAATGVTTTSKVAAFLAERIPVDRPVAVLLRHAQRPELPVGQSGDELALTEHGVRQARNLGAALNTRIITVTASPVRRCVETAQMICLGAAVDVPITQDRMLGNPGAFVTDTALAWQSFLQLGIANVAQQLIDSVEPPPGFGDSTAAARALANHLLAACAGRPGLHLFVTHDIILLPMVARLLGRSLDHAWWPRFLEPTALWLEDGRQMLRYREIVVTTNTHTE